MSTALADVDLEIAVSKVQRKWPRVPVADVEEAVGDIIVELLAKGGEWGQGAVVQGAYWRLCNRQKKRRREVSLDEALEADADQAPVELAVDTTDVAGETVERMDLDRHPVRRHLAEAVDAGLPPQFRRRGRANNLTRYSDEQVALARRLRAEGWTYVDIAKRIGCSDTAVTLWCEREIRVGLETPGWTRESMIEAVRRWAAEHGRSPTSAEARRDKTLPVACSYEPVFGRWNALLEAAGLPVRKPGWRHVVRQPT